MNVTSRRGGWRSMAYFSGFLALAAGCSVPHVYVLGTADAGRDAVRDVGTDAVRDASLDSAVDATLDATFRDGDASMDSPVSDGPNPDAREGGISDWPPTADSIAVVCTIASSCIQVFGQQSADISLSACVDSSINQFFALRNGGVPDQFFSMLIRTLNVCALHSFDCASAGQCISGGHDRAVCGDAGVESETCNGDDALYCDSNGTLVSFHCPDWNNQHCVANGSSGLGCTTGVACDGSMPDRCDGDYLVHCGSSLGVELETPCSIAYPGTTCQVTTDDAGVSTASCVPQGNPCQQQGPRCDGTNVLVECDRASNHEIRTDCAALFDSTCQVQGPTAQCGPAGTQCTASTPDNCPTSTTVGLCVNGKLERVTCSSIGLQGCTVDNNIRARCY